MLENLAETIYKANPDEDPGIKSKIYCSTQEIPDFAEDILDEICRTYIDVQTMIEPILSC
uniref:Uncharacterized protein n=1 Tax=Marseillevirus LCMAC201 TaxID=2506605 RepID=A0A481YW84_9VIRU|nr:MAG: hypothetical protein LCMAC201_02890 [Marseillevirus LCMAC201]